MLEFARWKYIVAILVVALAVLYALPNVYPQDPSVQVTANRSEAVDEALVQRVQSILGEAGVTPKSVAVESEDNLLVRLASAEIQCDLHLVQALVHQGPAGQQAHASRRDVLDEAEDAVPHHVDRRGRGPRRDPMAPPGLRAAHGPGRQAPAGSGAPADPARASGAALVLAARITHTAPSAMRRASMSSS